MILSDILRDNLNNINFISGYERRVLYNIVNCRTEIMGSRLQKCDHCGKELTLYNSCRNRNCPTCQTDRAIKWVNERVNELLPVNYFHLVFTIPKELRQIFLFNKTLMYKILFKSQSRTLMKIIKKMFGKPGFISVLHTWDQKLNYHPHIHTVIAGGGLSLDESKWKSSRKNFLLSVKILSKVFRGIMLFYLNKSYKDGLIRFPAKLKYMESERSFISICNNISKKDWNVYAKKPFAGPLQVLKYLSHYTHKVGISNRRLVSYDGKNVTFKYRDRSDGNKEKIMILPVKLFIQRFILHILPRRFVKTRFYGFLSNRFKKKNIELINDILGKAFNSTFDALPAFYSTRFIDISLCPFCKKGHFVDVKKINSS
jgi:ribosomal protein S8